ncbi:aminoglycoside phosphotransferase family protein [Oerskovia turbata]|uniref:Aminoglycoside phosphotransferase family protein n=1 Tax=Oerskovia turbata TaxID=1713 RepID=A0A4Q1KSY8_9CELL|nr:aminoglycoside phosphotransferase family protein [Oerskovia turbata]RXR25664.1 aminoglycoside phosphotransferase family protein [Oerskovia turbata]RXR33248.1 aminoglycoside phosphotransferase family protein [Oerskovia turbata]TGJ96317.1 aminoglycoside phosphotransferase family protein [Actinotalea fermentans ATCC 43279 = JCM 9966 = DSM 3133]
MTRLPEPDREVEASRRDRGPGASTSTQALCLAAHGQQAEELLTGGNSSTVVRRGDTVRRTAGPWTPTVQALLRHLRGQGVVEVPEPLGTDDQGREVLSFLAGDVAHYPLPPWVWDESVLRDAGALLRRVHDASAGFLAAGAGSADAGPATPTWQTAPHEPVEVVCHNDVAPYNLVFRDGVVVGLIDFDTASPGPRIWDLAYLGYRLAPLVADAGDGEGADVVGRLDPLARLDTLVAAYGMPYSRREVLTTVVARLDELAAFTDERASATGRDEFREHAAMYRADAQRVRALADASPR